VSKPGGVEPSRVAPSNRGQPVGARLRLARIDTLVKIRDALRVSADDLLVGINWRSGDYRPGAFVGDEQ